MRILLILLLLTSTCYATVLHRYTDSSGDEMGICYSGRDGSPAINNPDWTVEVITEGQKDFYIGEQKKQFKDKEKVKKNAVKQKRKNIKAKLKGLGLNQSEVDELVGASD